jgi:ADP-ribose pyrophosphatase
VYQAPPFIQVFRQKVRLPNGRVVEDYHRIRLTDFVMVLATTADGRIIVEQQYKHGIGKMTLVLPAGTVEPGEEPLAAARRELLEETGYAAERWRLVGSFTAHANYNCGTAHVFTAHDARAVSAPKSGDLEDIEIQLLQPQELFQAVREGRVHALSTAAAIALATHPDLSRGD